MRPAAGSGSTIDGLPARDRLRVVYVAGSGHTGSTLLALLLDSHPDIACVGETSVKPRIRRRGDAAVQPCSCGSLITRCQFWTEVFTAVRNSGHDFGASHWSNDYQFEHPLARRLVNRACISARGRAALSWAAKWLPFYRGRVRKIDRVNGAFVRAVVDTAGASVFADTSKQAPRLLHLLLVPDLEVSVVQLVRDVRAYAASAKRRGLPTLGAAQTWLHDQEALAGIVSQLPPERVHRLRYEDLCASTGATLSRLWKFCGVEPVIVPDVVQAAQHHVLGNAIRMVPQLRIRLDETWRERLSDDEQRGILGIAGEVNRQLGYI